MGLRRDAEHSRVQEISDELSEGIEHFRSAAALGATAAAERLAPKVGRAREAIAPRVTAAREAVSPRMEQARDLAARSWETTVASLAAAADQAKHPRGKGRRKDRGIRGWRTSAEPAPRRRWPWLVGVLALGAAAGVVGALVARRRTPPWEEYEPEHASSPMRDAWHHTREKAGHAVGTAKEKAGHAVETVKDKATAARTRTHSQPSPTGPGVGVPSGDQALPSSPTATESKAATESAPGGTATDKPTTSKANSRTKRSSTS